MIPCPNYHWKKYSHFAAGYITESRIALLSHDYDTGFAAGKASAQKEILCMLAADGMPAEKIALLLRIKTGTVLEIMAAKRAHIEKCRKKLEQAVKP